MEEYQQGFILAAIHPFVQPSNGKERIPQEQIFRAVLMKRTERNEKTDVNNEGYSLELEFVVSSEQLAGKTMIPDFIEKIKGAAGRGLKFVGIIHQYTSQVNHNTITNKEPTHNSSADRKDAENVSNSPEVLASLGSEKSADGTNGFTRPASSEKIADQGTKLSKELKGEGEVTQQPDPGREENGEQCQQELTETVNKQEMVPSGDIPSSCDEVAVGKTEIFAIFNKPKSHHGCSKYYTVHIPMKVYKNGQTVNSLEANWLEHMTEHFKRGGSLVNAAFYLGMVNDSSQGSTDGVFIFEEFSEDNNRTTRGYDAIVVEQWTVLEGVKVQTDYVPLLNSLAVYGWQLTCILPTPIVKTNREGNLSTKQIVFLQRPSLPQKPKKRESKFQWRFSKEEKQGKQSKKSVKDKVNAKESQPSEENLIENKKNVEEESARIEDVEDGLTDLRIEMDGIIPQNEAQTLAEENLQQESGQESEERLHPGRHEGDSMEIFADGESKEQDSSGESCAAGVEADQESTPKITMEEEGTVAATQEMEGN
ncbi:raftlin isoform X2 [Rhinatrema bivittatum]|nr:raftlin isoform X2 [Rhinatrema bivittatum]